MESRLPVTRWSLILGAKTQDATRRRLLMEDLMNAYWKPVYCFLRRRGYDNEDAKDLTQGFLHEFIVEDKLLVVADRAIGGFRQLLLTALRRFVSNAERDKRRKKRRPQGSVVNLGALDLGGLDVRGSTATPEHAFYYAWVTELIDQVLTEVKQQYCGSHMATHWTVFQRKVLAPIFQDTRDRSLKEICEECGVDDEAKASNMIITVKRRFQSVLRRRLRSLVRSDGEAETEFREILKFLSEEGAG